MVSPYTTVIKAKNFLFNTAVGRGVTENCYTGTPDMG